MNENVSTKKTVDLLSSAGDDKFMADFNRIHHTDAHGMLESIAKELKLTDYTL